MDVYFFHFNYKIESRTYKNILFVHFLKVKVYFKLINSTMTYL